MTITVDISGDTRAGKLTCNGHVSHTIDTNSGMYRGLSALLIFPRALSGFVLTWPNRGGNRFNLPLA